jgi:hypothetical protein
MKNFKDYFESLQDKKTYNESNTIQIDDKTINIVNCTPHAVVVNDVIYPKSNSVARIKVDLIDTDNDLFKMEKKGSIEDLPSKKEGTLYIVSAIVFSSSDRKDLIAPNTGKANRDDKGNIISVPNFICKWNQIKEIL